MKKNFGIINRLSEKNTILNLVQEVTSKFNDYYLKTIAKCFIQGEEQLYTMVKTYMNELINSENDITIVIWLGIVDLTLLVRYFKQLAVNG